MRKSNIPFLSNLITRNDNFLSAIWKVITPYVDKLQLYINNVNCQLCIILPMSKIICMKCFSLIKTFVYVQNYHHIPNKLFFNNLCFLNNF